MHRHSDTRNNASIQYQSYETNDRPKIRVKERSNFWRPALVEKFQFSYIFIILLLCNKFCRTFFSRRFSSYSLLRKVPPLASLPNSQCRISSTLFAYPSPYQRNGPLWRHQVSASYIAHFIPLYFISEPNSIAKCWSVHLITSIHFSLQSRLRLIKTTDSTPFSWGSGLNLLISQA